MNTQASEGTAVDRNWMLDGMPVASRDALIGGQAVLEGVMMRGVSIWAVAVRNLDGEIELTSEPSSPGPSATASRACR